MKKKTRRKLFWGIFTAVVLLGVGAALYFFFPREKSAVVKVYFFKGEKLFAVTRPLKADESPLRKAIAELLAGPTQKETSQGIITEVPKGTKLLSLEVKDRTAIVNFNRRLEAYGGGSARLQGMISQIICTATEIPGVEKVWIWIEGQKDVVLGGEGLVLDRPLSRREVGY